MPVSPSSFSFSCHDDVRERVWGAPSSLSPSLRFCLRVHGLSRRTPPELNKLRGRLRCGGGIKFSTSSHFTFDLLGKKCCGFLVTKDTTGSSFFLADSLFLQLYVIISCLGKWKRTVRRSFIQLVPESLDTITLTWNGKDCSLLHLVLSYWPFIFGIWAYHKY